MSDVRYTEITAEEEGQRLDNYLLRILKGVPKSHIYRIVRQGEVRINKKRAKPTTRLVKGDAIRIPPIRTASAKEAHLSEKMKDTLLKTIIFEDAKLLVINKPAGIAVHGGSGLSLGIIEAFRKLRSDLHYLELVHRLDRETSGCLILAKKRSVLRSMQALFESRAIKKTYWALLHGAWSGKKKLMVEASLQKNSLKSGERIVRITEAGKASRTFFQLKENFEDAAFVEAIPETGRTHQIRVHAASLGHPILGDEKYGAPLIKPMALFLHAKAIEFNLEEKTYRFEAEPDNRFNAHLNALRAHEMGIKESSIDK